MRTLACSAFVLVLAACGGTSTAPASGAGSAGSAPTGSAEPAAPAASTCVKTGCSGTICAEADDGRMTTCEFKPEYACYRQATCERQADGACGWTQSAELAACLASPPPM